MGTAFLYGNGGGHQLHYDIVCQLAEPEKKEGRIWVKSSVPMNYVEWNNNPRSGGTVGRVNIGGAPGGYDPASSNNVIEIFNTKLAGIWNRMKFTPTFCRQVQESTGNWIDVNAYICHSNTWIQFAWDWDGTILQGNNQYTIQTGGWQGIRYHWSTDLPGGTFATLTWNTDNVILKASSKAAGSLLVTKNAIDLTNWKTIRFTTTANSDQVLGQVSTKTGDSFRSGQAASISLSVGNTDLDISSLSGNYYIGVQPRANKTATLTKIQLLGRQVSEVVPDYILTAADTLATKVAGHTSNNSIKFAVMADAHLGYYTDTDNAVGTQAGQALQRLNKKCALDFVAHVGDYSTGAWNSTVDTTLENISDYQALIGSKGSSASIWCIGNHDDAPYQATANRLTQAQLYTAIGQKNLSSGGIVPNNACYGYTDFSNLKLRVIYLDTHDRRSWSSNQVNSGAECNYLNIENISGEQLRWLASTALNFSNINNSSEWSILVFSHAALNTSGTYTDVSNTVHSCNTNNAATILKAYATKKSGSITHGGVTINYDFTTIAPAGIIGCIHGHEHRYADETVGDTFLSICCPNICNGRERASKDGTIYTKTANSANGTSFCVFNIDRTNKKIYVDHYGPGIDREFDYIIPDPNAPSYTNQLPLAIDTDGSIYNNTGWKAGYRLNSSGSAEGLSGSYITGFIPAKIGDTVYLKNVQWQNGISSGSLNSGNQRVSFYDANKKHLAQSNAIAVAGTLNGIKDSNGIWTQFTLRNFSGGTLTNAAYFRLNCAGITNESIITVNEAIEQ